MSDETKKRKPSHPGELFKSTVLDERGITVHDAAKCLGVSRKALSEFVNGKVRCTPTMARRISESMGTSVSMWLNMQASLDIWHAENVELNTPVSILPDCQLTASA